MIFINIIDGVNKEILTGSWSILLIAAGFYAVMFLVSFGMTKFFHLSENCAGICQAMMLFGNIGFMAVPVISSVFPGNGILYVSVFMVFDQLMLWTLGVKLTTPTGSGGFELKKLIQSGNSGNPDRDAPDADGCADSGTSRYRASENRCHSISSGDDLHRRYFCGASAEKISERVFAVWNCACAHAACTSS